MYFNTVCFDAGLLRHPFYSMWFSFLLLVVQSSCYCSVAIGEHYAVRCMRFLLSLGSACMLHWILRLFLYFSVKWFCHIVSSSRNPQKDRSVNVVDCLLLLSVAIILLHLCFALLARLKWSVWDSSVTILASIWFDSARSSLMSSSDVFACAADGKRVQLHDLCKLPAGTTIRLVRFPIKGHTRDSLSSKTTQEIRTIATTLGIKRGSGGRAARVLYKKEELIERILQQRAMALKNGRSDRNQSD